MSGVPKLPAKRVGGAFVAFCPQCEAPHTLPQRGRGRADRCAADSGSAFLATGFEFEMAGDAMSDLGAMPRCARRAILASGDAKAARHFQFWRKLNADPGALRSAALKALFGAGRIVRGEFLAFLPQGSVSCDLRSGAYRMSVAGETFGGVGVLALARDAFGVSEATAARRLLEALGGFRMPGERALALETAIGAALDEGPR